MTPVVLIVDDSATNRYLLAFHLRAQGWEIAEAESGVGALALAATRPPQIVLLDLHMPEMDGFETATRLRALPGAAAIPIIAVTANVSPAARATARVAGFSAFLTKPIDPELLWAEIQRHLKPPAP